MICPDGQTRDMTMDIIGDFAPDIAESRLIMVQGVVEIDGATIHGEAWRKLDVYHFFSK